MDLQALVAQAQHLDPASLLAGAVGARTLEAAAVRAIRPLPRLAVGVLKARIQALQAAGKIDAPTMRLLAAYGRATFAWADQELPDKPGPEKMAAVLDRLAAVPYLGLLIRADRAGAQEVLQAAYDAVKDEAKTEAGDGPGGQPDGPKTPPAPAPGSGAPPAAGADPAAEKAK
ncbi:MAG: hypothetical protein V4510_09965 [bacterium]